MRKEGSQVILIEQNVNVAESHNVHPPVAIFAMHLRQ